MCWHNLLIDYQARWPWIELFYIRAFHLPLSHCLGEVLEERMFRNDSLTSQCRQFTGAPSCCLWSAQLISKSAHWNSTLVLVGFLEPGSVDFMRQRFPQVFIFSWVLSPAWCRSWGWLQMQAAQRGGGNHLGQHLLCLPPASEKSLHELLLPARRGWHQSLPDPGIQVG